MAKNTFVKQALPERKKTENKYSVGQIVMIGGADSMSGALNLSGMAALRSGAGIVKVFHLAKKFPCAVLELIHTHLDFDKLELLEKESERTKSFCIGPGLGRSERVEQFLQYFLPKIKVACVIDADALYYFQGNRNKVPFILTPHEGELKHLLNMPDVSDRLVLIQEAQKFADEHNVILVCKGGPTVIVSKGAPKILIPFGNSAMATAGMGDVLSGVIASMLCQINNPLIATILACQIHALAGAKACKKKKAGLIASDCVHELVHFLK